MSASQEPPISLNRNWKKLAGWVWSSNEGNPFKFNINLVGHYRDQLNFKAGNGKMTNEDYDKLEAAAEFW